MAPAVPPASRGRDADADARQAQVAEAARNEHPSRLPPSSSSSSSSVGDDLAQALRDLARGEQTATALEANLTSLESKLDEILATFGVSAEDEESSDAQHDVHRKDGNRRDAADDRRGGTGD
ncbi:hypothetical protein VTK56DRAFT_3536 [Thermocarpiscus australiensis]